MPSLTDILAQEELIREINTSNNSLPKIEIQPGTLAISHYGVILKYSPQAFAETPELYLSRQLEAHQVYRRELNRDIKRIEYDARELSGKQQNRSWTAEMFSEGLVRTVTRFFVEPSYWIFSLRSWEKSLTADIETEQKKVNAHNFLRTCFLYSAEILESSTPQHKIGALEIKVGDCANAAREIARLYTTLSFQTERKKDLLRERHQILFSKKLNILF